jgi:maltooligosyltrehalose synthase
MKTYKNLITELAGRKPEGKVVFKKTIKKIPVLVTQGKDSFVAYVDGDHLDHYDSLNDAKKAIDNVIKELT